MSTIDRRTFLARSAAAATLAALKPGAILAQPVRGHVDPSGRFGSLLNREEFDRAPHALRPAILALFASQTAMRSIVRTGPDHQHVLTGLPPIIMQGTNKSLGFPGSCEACSFGYGLGTYTAARGYPGFDPSERANRISAAWLFSWAQRRAGFAQYPPEKGQFIADEGEGTAGTTGSTSTVNMTSPKRKCQGSKALPYLGLLIAEGAPSAAQVPYKPDCAYIDGITTSIDSYSGIGKFKIGSYKTLPNFLNGQSTYLTLMKQYINAGHAIAFSGLVAQGYDNPATTMVNGAFAPASASFKKGSGHGQVIVGYDDSLGHTGAFLIQNSFGKDWPYLSATDPLMQGRLWWAYESFYASQGFGAIAYPIPPFFAYPSTVTLSSPNPGAPAARIIEAVRGDDNGESFAAFELDFAQPVQLITLRVTPLRADSPVVGGYNAPITYGFARVTRRTSFPAGRYTVELDAHTLSSDLTQLLPLTYRGHVTIS